MKSTAFYDVMACTLETAQRFIRTVSYISNFEELAKQETVEFSRQAGFFDLEDEGGYVPPKSRSVSHLRCIPIRKTFRSVSQ
jgi:hypothetical protein